MISFKQYSNVTKIIIPNKVKLSSGNFGDMFYCMTNLVNVNLPYEDINITNMYGMCYGCSNLTGSPVCGEHVVNMGVAYSHCYNITGSPVCGENVVNMVSTYYRCHNLTGFPVCGNNVVNMSSTYALCYNLTGNPVCGNNVVNMSSTYDLCYNLTGNPVCGNNVVNMSSTYNFCYNLTGNPVCGSNVVDMSYTYQNCRNLTSNAYFYATNLQNVQNCFYERNTQKQLNIYAPIDATNTINTLLKSDNTSLMGEEITWTDDMATNNCYYNTAYNIYIYPVANVAETRTANGDDYIPCTGIELVSDKGRPILYAGDWEKITLTPILTPANTTDVLIWTSSDTSIATVVDGVIRGASSFRGAEDVTITAYCGDSSAEYIVRVIDMSTDEF